MRTFGAIADRMLSMVVPQCATDDYYTSCGPCYPTAAKC
jgi:hypothetical protein